MPWASISSAASDGQGVGGNAAGRGVHDLGGRGRAQVGPGFDAPAQVAVGKDAQHLPAPSTTAEQPRPLALISRIRSLKLASGHAGHGVAAAHHVAHMGQQLAAQRTAGVRAGKVFGAEAPRVEQGHGQGVAHGQLGGGAGRGGQVQRAGFALHAAVEHQVGMLGQGGLSPPVIAIRGTPRRLSTGRMA
jgi:hypothetical protein